MNSLIVVVGSVGLVLLIALIAAIVWLSRARSAQVEAESESKALREGKERRRVADQIMSESVAYEPAWLRRVRERLRESRDR